MSLTMRRCAFSTLFFLVAVIAAAKIHYEQNVSSAMAFTRNSIPVRRSTTLTSTRVKQKNVFGFRIPVCQTERYSSILFTNTNGDASSGEYLGALDRAVRTGDFRKLGKRETFWVERCRELVEYERKHGNCDVPQPTRRGEKKTQLQIWVTTQRTQYRFYQQDKEPCSMTEERIAILEGMGFKWEITGWSGEHAGWKVRYEELIQYKGIHGDCNVPKGWKENPKLAEWVNTQRAEYRYLKEGRPSTMTDARIDLLEKLGFDWYVNGPQVEWELRYDELKEYKEQYGDCNVPREWKENPKLGIWVDNQRKQYRLLQEGKKSSMTDERIALLEKIEFNWYVYADWELRYEELEQYKKQYGDCNVPQNWKENQQLGNWVTKQRTEYRLLKEGKPSAMTDERIDALERIGFEWTVSRGRRRKRRKRN